MGHSNTFPLPSAPTETADLYPESDGKPMAETERHFRELLKNFNRIENHFAHIPDVYVLGDMMMYYEEGNPRKSISPDIFVAFGIGKKERRIYKIWEEGKPPDFILEFASKGTYRNDLTRKVQLYAEIGIPEYFVYDVDRRYLPSPLLGFRLIGDDYVEIASLATGGLPSVTLGLEFHALDDSLGIYDPEAEAWLKTSAERAEDAEERAEDAEERANQEADARHKAEAEVARLQAELERLKARL
ncbi:MAG: Uma2 family endonuclease [Candidatus Poribacteria bacterium]|nr:Uma2 family endonuclease [Candidatus Poribacteria bacterium]MDE0466624.1 Uma2 family endonuclease [Candidatus Poribacteria bacterium]